MFQRSWPFGLCLVAIVVGGLGLANPARGGALDPREIALVMESSLVDLDVAMIAMRNGPDYAAQMRYLSRIDDNAWNGRLTGTYDGLAVDIYYSGTVTAVGGPTNQYDIAWTSDWLVGDQTSSGSGTATYQDPPFTFHIDIQSGTVSGSGEILPGYQISNITLSGTKDLVNKKLTVSDTLNVGIIPFVGSAGTLDLTLVYDQVTGAYTSTASLTALGGWLYQQTWTANSGTIGTPTPAPPAPPARPNPAIELWPEGEAAFGDPGVPGFNTMTIATVPEPATGLMMVLAAMFVKRRNRVG